MNRTSRYEVNIKLKFQFITTVAVLRFEDNIKLIFQSVDLYNGRFRLKHEEEFKYVEPSIVAELVILYRPKARSLVLC